MALMLSIRLSQRVCERDLRVKLDTLSCKTLHRFVDEENKEYIRYTIPKKVIALGQEFAISLITRLRL
jgi:hypothetical protein